MIVGNGVYQEVQREAGGEGADIFMALANGDNRNAMAAQVALHIHGACRAWWRAFSIPERAEIYRELGIGGGQPDHGAVQSLVRAGGVRRLSGRERGCTSSSSAAERWGAADGA